MRAAILTIWMVALVFSLQAQQTKVDLTKDVTGVTPVANGGTGQDTAQEAIDALVPSQTGNALKSLQTDGTTVSWQAPIRTDQIASPPGAPYTGLIIVFTDALSPSDCVTGGGSALSLCRYNGSTYDAIGGGAVSGLADPGANGMLSRTSSGVTTARTLTGTNGVSCVNGDGVSGNPTCQADTAILLTREQAQRGGDLFCSDSTGSGTVKTCALSPVLPDYDVGTVIRFVSTTSNTAGAFTLNVNSIGPIGVKLSDGVTDPAIGDFAAGTIYNLVYTASDTFALLGGSGSGGGGSDPNELYSGIIDFGDIPDGGCLADTFTATGLTAGATLSVSLPASFPAGTVATAVASAADTAQIRICNLSGATVNPASATFKVRAMDSLGYTIYSGTINFTSIPDGGCLTDSILATGAAAGDAVAPGFPSALEAGLFGTMWVPEADTINVQLCNLSGAAVDPASATFAAAVTK